MLVPLIGAEVKGSKRWIDLIFLPRFQPIEFVKPLFIIFIAKIIVLNYKTNLYGRHLYSFFVLSLISVLLINQPDLGQTILLIASWITVVFVAGFNMAILALLGFLVLSFITLLIYFLPTKFGYILSRIQIFINPKTEFNFQSQKALDAIKQGGLTGQGMGEGI